MKTKIIYSISCIACNNLRQKIIWNEKVRIGAKKFSKRPVKVIQCLSCNLVRLLKISKKIEDSAVARSIYNKSNSVDDFIKFHKPREIKKFNFIKSFINFKNCKILESNSGSGIILNLIKKDALMTAGLDSIIYRDFLENNGHEHFSSIKNIKDKKYKFDIILSFSELEHKYNPIKFLLDLKSILKKNGKLIIRVPNFLNIYKFLIEKNFLKFDFRESHNFYFSEKNLNFIFKRTGFNIKQILGFNEYSFNHLLNFANKKKRIYNQKINFFVNEQNDKLIVKNIENNHVSTSLMYILSKKN
jgi:2-polyprenyl-3-methyl-5-hydroxy-6-metoxy-1,4-benzoquinol methylase